MNVGAGFWTGWVVGRDWIKLREAFGVVGETVYGVGRTGSVDGVVTPGLVTGAVLARGCTRSPEEVPGEDVPGQVMVDEEGWLPWTLVDWPGYWTVDRAGVARAIVVPGATAVAGLLPPGVRIVVEGVVAGRVAVTADDAVPAPVVGRLLSSWIGDGVMFIPGAVGVEPAVAGPPGRLGRLEFPAPCIVVLMEPGRDGSRDTVTGPLLARSCPRFGR